MAWDLDQFDALLLKAINDVLTEVVGNINTQIIYDYLEKRGCPPSEICQKLEVFSMELGMLLGSETSQMLGSAGILEKTVLKVLCSKIGIACNPERADFPEYVRELKEVYKQRRQAAASKVEMEVKNP
jgi:hypothetical protein